MATDLTPHYRDAQAFKDEHKNGGATGDMNERLRQAVNEQFGRKGMTPQQRHTALYGALRGIAWLAAMCEQYEIDPDTLLDAPEDITRNVVGNTRGLGFDPKSIELGVGAAYFTGLLVGLKARER